MSGDGVAFNHVGQCVTDLERSKRFYCELLGFTFDREINPPDDAVGASCSGSTPPLGHDRVVPRARRPRARAAALRRAPARPQPYRAASDERAGPHAHLALGRRPRRGARAVADYGGEVIADSNIGVGRVHPATPTASSSSCSRWSTAAASTRAALTTRRSSGRRVRGSAALQQRRAGVEDRVELRRRPLRSSSLRNARCSSGVRASRIVSSALFDRRRRRRLARLELRGPSTSSAARGSARPRASLPVAPRLPSPFAATLGARPRSTPPSASGASAARRPACRRADARSSCSSQPRGSTSAAAWRWQRSPCVRAALSSSSTSQAWRSVDWKRSVATAGALQPGARTEPPVLRSVPQRPPRPELMAGGSPPPCARPLAPAPLHGRRSRPLRLTSLPTVAGLTVADVHDTGSNGTGATKSPRQQRALRVEQAVELVLELVGGPAASCGRGRDARPASPSRAVPGRLVAVGAGPRAVASRAAVLELPAARRREQPRSPAHSSPRAAALEGVSSHTVHVVESNVNVATRDRAASEARALPFGMPRVATLAHALKVPVGSARRGGNRTATTRERARLTRVQDGWLVRVPASSANLGPAFDAVAVALGTHLEVSADGDEPAPETHPAVRAFRNAGGRGPLCVRVALSRRARARVLGRRARRRPARGARAARAHARARRAPRPCASPPSSRATPTTRPPRSTAASSRSRAGTWCASRSPASSPSSCGFPRARPRPPAPGASSPTRSRSTTRCSTSGRTALLVAALAAGAVDAMRAATEDRLHQNRRLARARDTRAAIDAMLDAGAFAAWLSGSGPSAAAFVDRDDAAGSRPHCRTIGPRARARHRRRGSGRSHEARQEVRGGHRRGRRDRRRAARAGSRPRARAASSSSDRDAGRDRDGRRARSRRAPLRRDRGRVRRHPGVAAAGAGRRGRGPLRADRPLLLERGRDLARRRRGLRRTTGSSASTST